jgi:hypothetical protein
MRHRGRRLDGVLCAVFNVARGPWSRVRVGVTVFWSSRVSGARPVVLDAVDTRTGHFADSGSDWRRGDDHAGQETRHAPKRPDHVSV